MPWVLWVYVIIGLGSLILLIAMLFLGGLDVLGFDFDVGDVDVDTGGPGMGPLSIPIILCFLSAFGTVGALLTLYGMKIWMTPFIAAAGAFLLAGILFSIIQLFLRQFTSDSTVQINKLKGRRGKVTVPIRKDMEGQVAIFTQQRGRTLVPAVADRDIPENADIVIVETSGSVVKVRKRDIAKRSAPSGKK